MISSKPRLVVPYGLKTVLEGVSRAILKTNPGNITQFAALYFKELILFREANSSLDIKDLVKQFHQIKVEKWSEGTTQEKKPKSAKESEPPIPFCEEPKWKEKSTDTEEDNIVGPLFSNKTTQFPSVHTELAEPEETTESVSEPSPKASTPKVSTPPSSPSPLAAVSPEFAYVPADPAQLAAQMLGNVSSVHSEVLMVDVATSMPSFCDMYVSLEASEEVSSVSLSDLQPQLLSQTSVRIELGSKETKAETSSASSLPLQGEQDLPAHDQAPDVPIQADIEITSSIQYIPPECSESETEGGAAFIEQISEHVIIPLNEPMASLPQTVQPSESQIQIAHKTASMVSAKSVTSAQSIASAKSVPLEEPIEFEPPISSTKLALSVYKETEGELQQSAYARFLQVEASVKSLQAEASAKSLPAEASAKSLSAEPSAKSLPAAASAKSLPAEAFVRSLQKEASAKSLQAEVSARSLQREAEASAKSLLAEASAQALQMEGSVKFLQAEASVKFLEVDASAKSLHEEASAKSLEASKPLQVEASAKSLQDEASAMSLQAERSIKSIHTTEGSVKSIHPEGSVKSLQAEKSVKSVHTAEGSVKSLHTPEGSAKSLQVEKSVKSLHAEGSVKSVHPEGSVKSVHTEGSVKSVYTAEGSAKSLHTPEGSAKSLQVEKSVKSVHTAEGSVKSVHTPEGSVKSLLAEGSVKSVHTADGSVKSLNAEGSVKSVHTAEGSAKSLHTEGSVKSIHTAEGSAKSLQAEGSAKSLHVEGSVKSMLTVEGSAKSVHVEGSPKLIHTEGFIKSLHAEGSAKSVHAEGSAKSVHAEGSIKSVHTEGSVKSTHAEGSAKSVAAEGSAKSVRQGSANSVHAEGSPKSIHSESRVSSASLEETTNVISGGTPKSVRSTVSVKTAASGAPHVPEGLTDMENEPEGEFKGEAVPEEGLVPKAIAASEAGPPPPHSNMWTLYCLTDMSQQSRPSPPPAPGPFPQATLYLANAKDPQFLQQPPKVTSPTYVMMDDSKRTGAPPFILVGSNVQETQEWKPLPGHAVIAQPDPYKRYTAVQVPVAVSSTEQQKFQKHTPAPQNGSSPPNGQDAPRPQSPVFLSVAIPIEDVGKKGTGSGDKRTPFEGSYGIAGEITVTTAHLRRNDT